MKGPEFSDAASALSDCTDHRREFEFAQGTIIGLRMWRINTINELTGVAHTGFTWRSGTNQSECGLTYSYHNQFGLTMTGARRSGRCLNEYCGCGFWAYHNGSIYPYGDIAGVISAWGKTTIGTKGFRSEYGKILALYVPTRFIWPRTSDQKLNRLFYGMPFLHFALIVYGIVAGTWFTAIANFSMLSGWLGALVLVSRKRADAGGIEKLSSETIEGLKKNYPDVKFYDDYDQMVRDFPPSYETDKVA